MPTRTTDNENVQDNLEWKFEASGFVVVYYMIQFIPPRNRQIFINKTHSLKGKLKPFSTQGNTNFLTCAGFADIIKVFKHIPFEGEVFLAIK